MILAEAEGATKRAQGMTGEDGEVRVSAQIPERCSTRH